MTDLRQAAQQALEALEGGADSWQLVGPAIDALKEALVEDAMQKFTDVNQELEAALAEPVLNPAPGYCKHCKQYTIEEPLPAEPVQEPVAWMYDCGNGGRMYAEELDSVPGWMPLYTAPPKRKPLTEEEIRDLLEAEFLGRDGKRSWDDDLQVFRLAERAHGITKEMK